MDRLLAESELRAKDAVNTAVQSKFGSPLDNSVSDNNMVNYESVNTTDANNDPICVANVAKNPNIYKTL